VVVCLLNRNAWILRQAVYNRFSGPSDVIHNE
jgi:hypothetical protein